MNFAEEQSVTDSSASSPRSVESDSEKLLAAERERRGALLAAADAARDSKRWSEAARLYRDVLELDPATTPIWVQYGHMLKESGLRNEAQIAYERALKLDPLNADTHLQMGHLLKINNKKISAIEMYSRALELDPQLREAERELRALGADARSNQILEGAAVIRPDSHALPNFYFDISDLIFHHFPSNRSPTGIQRIVLAVAEAAVDGGQATDVGLCVLEGDTGKWKLVDTESALHLMMLSHEGAANSDWAWKSALGDVHRALAAKRPLVFPRGSTVVSLGAPWGIRRYFAAVRAAKRQSGIRSVGYIHDTVPLLYPEYCDGVVPQEFLRWLRRLSTHADLVLANSHSTKNDFDRALATIGARPVRCEVVYPNGDFASLFQESEEISPEVAALAGTDYVLFVGTVQPRKNHLMVVAAWRELIKELGPDKVPNLVLAGKLGWYWEQLVEYIRKTDSLDGKLTMLNKASDADLKALYKDAKFTIYNSHYEGWGLPVTESLSFGKVPVISRNSALLESGGKHAVFYDTNSQPSFVATIRELLANPAGLKKREAAIQAEPPVRSWREVFRETRETVDAALGKQISTVVGSEPSMKLGNLYRFGQVPDVASDKDLANFETVEDIVPEGAQWWDSEDWGVWSRSKAVELEFKLPEYDERRNNILLLHLRGHRQPAQLTVELNGVLSEPIFVPASAPGVPPAEMVVRMNIGPRMVRDKKVSLTISQSELTDLERLTGGADRRSIGVGFRSILICAEDDLAARITFLESVAGYTSTIVAAVQRASKPLASGDETDGGFLRLGEERADVAHAPEKLARAGRAVTA